MPNAASNVKKDGMKFTIGFGNLDIAKDQNNVSFSGMGVDSRKMLEEMGRKLRDCEYS